MRFLTPLLLALVLASAVSADEGMWLFNQPPRQLLKDKYQFDLDDAWLTRMQKASIRFPSASGSFVSADGLCVTNHHVGSDAIQKLSTKEKNLYRDGFLARTRAEELKCPDMELIVLQSIEDVTDKVQGTVTKDMSAAQGNAARRAIMNRLEQESLKKTGLRADVVTLYQGGLYHLYRYKKYTDVRLVFAPEHDIASFGGDVDNFEYPRWNLDVCFFRAYENDQPAKIEHYLKWSPTGPKEGELVFVSGHPGTTNRLETLEKLKHRRDHTLPYLLARLRQIEALLIQYGATGPEPKRNAQTDLYGVANARKALTGQYQGLLNPDILASKATAEKVLLRKLVEEVPPAVYLEYKRALNDIAAAEKKLAQFEREYYLLESGDAFYSRHFRIARTLVRLAEEKAKPDGERLREFREAGLESLKRQLFSPAPISAELERVKLAGSLAFLAEQLGGEHPLAVKVMVGKSPAERAASLTGGTKLADPGYRKKLAELDLAGMRAEGDPMIQLAFLIDPEARALRKRFEEEVQEPEQQAYARLTKTRFDLFGTQVPPDATFTLRLAFGTVQGYSVDGQKLPFATTFKGLFERADLQQHKEPFGLPKRWVDGKTKLDLATPFNFTSTADTIGGNSGSPVVNRAGELVGLNFDRNRHGLVRNFVYTDEQARHISVHSGGILEALRTLYGADELVRELTK